MTLPTMPLPLRVLASFFLLTIGVGYLFAVAYLYLLDVEPHRKHGMGLVRSRFLNGSGRERGNRSS